MQGQKFYKYIIRALICLIFESLFYNIVLAANLPINTKPNLTIVTIESGDTTESLAYTFISKKFPEKLDDIKSYIDELIYWNPHITDWKNLPKGVNIYLGYPYPSNMEDRISMLSKFTLSGSYNISLGNLSENSSVSSSTSTSTQNSSLSFGLQMRYNLAHWEKVILSSIYYSQLQLSSINVPSESKAVTIHFPAEIGANIYYQFSFKKLSILPYAGLDYENINTFNTKDLLTGSSLEVRRNKMYYLTLGLGRWFEVSHYVFIVRGSVSRTIFSQTSSLLDSDKFKGYRAIINLGFKESSSPWLFNLFYKSHILNGPTELIINRFGAGIGFSFF